MLETGAETGDVGKEATAVVPTDIPHVPTEVLEEIFLRLATEDLLLRACLVCKTWRQVIQNSMFWRKKLTYGRRPTVPRAVLHNPELDWQFYAALSQRHCYDVNLIKNGCGELVEVLTIHQAIELENNSEDSDSSWPEYPHWTVLSSGGQGWTLELLADLDSDLRELSHSACFSTSFHSCSKEQLVHLCLPEHILDQFQPTITVSDYYTKSPEHAAVYELHVCVLDGCGNVMGKSFSFRENMERTDSDRWRQVSHAFKDYGVGARYVKFYHGGMAMDMEEGWYGAKMTGSTVKVSFPETRKTTMNYRCSCKTRHRS